jgi:MtaA/CmuA family methyltransferase
MIYPEDRPPFLEKPIIRTETDLNNIKRPDPSKDGGRMADRAKGVEEMVRAKGDECLVLGWVDMPFAELCSVCGVTEVMMMLIDKPLLAHKILDFLTEIVIDFCRLQLDNGAPMIGAGDAVASLISSAHYREFALPYEQRVVEAVHADGGLVKLHICGNTTALLADMIESGCDLFNVDHMVDFKQAADIYCKANVCFKGNLDPVSEIMQVDPEQCRSNALDRMKLAEGCRYMLSAGCEIPAETSDETFRAFCNAPKA